MSKLNAFVGHSFTPEDESVVRAFLKFFDQVKGMNFGFTWQHAEPAEPKVLAAKVLGLMEDKNLFIGICTKKEVVVSPDKLKKGYFKKGRLSADEENFHWATSDWIVQEIGLAKGRGMELILIVETGLRKPGGLQGDLEYIPFDRESPEKSFGKILEMIRALMPKGAVVGDEEAGIRAAPEGRNEGKERHGEKDGLEEKEGGEWYRVKPDWDRRKFELSLTHALVLDQAEAAKEIYDAYLETEDGQVQENRESWEALREYLCLIFGKGGKLGRLQEMERRFPNNSKIHEYLARGYQEYDEHEKAAASFIRAAELSKDPESQLASYRDATSAFVQSGKEDDAKVAVQRMRVLATAVDDGETILLKSIREIVERANDDDGFFGLTERILQIHPDDSDARFRLAFKYSEAGHHNLAMIHYLKIPYQERAGGTWNNLGVEMDHFNLGSKSVNAYRKAEELGETLAMSNLAQKLIRAGFLVEAEAICERAVKISDYHKNVGYAITKIKDVPGEEDKKEKEITTKAMPIGEFYRGYGQALIRGDLEDIAGVWRGKKCSLNVGVRNGRFRAEGVYEQEVSLNRLGLAWLGNASDQPAKKTKCIVRYDGAVSGYAIKGTMSVEEEGAAKSTATLLSIDEKTKEVLMVVSDDLKEIRIFEKGATESERFYVLVKS